MQELAYPSSRADAATEALKLPPHSIEAEQAVLGGLMIDNGTWDQVADLVLEEDFARAQISKRWLKVFRRGSGGQLAAHGFHF